MLHWINKKPRLKLKLHLAIKQKLIVAKLAVLEKQRLKILTGANQQITTIKQQHQVDLYKFYIKNEHKRLIGYSR